MCDQDTVEKIQKQLRAGEPFKKIAADCGVSARLVEMVKLKFGINYYHKTSDDKMDKIAKCIGGGMSALMTAKMCGVSTFTIRKVCKSRNLTSSYAKRLTPAIKEEMKRRLDQGETCEEVAKAYGFSLFSVRCFQQAANRLQAPSESAKEHCLSPLVTESEIQKIQDLLRSGMSLLQVAIASNRSKSTVFKIKSKMHLYRQPARPPVANLEEIEVPREQVEVPREERKDSTKLAESPGASITTVKHVNYESNAQTQPIVKQEQVESLALFTEIAPGSTSAVESMASVKILNEIPFCVLI
ncbi:hypothetical protein BC940DRAFT_336304 [Gongronella butleri]|nr:hypothetical protein BC940DRAFT_336304 [Gongronella butleri]